MPKKFSYKTTNIELNFLHLMYNAEQYRSIIGKDACLAMVVKGNAYGHGICEIAYMADQITTINMLCTFSLSEALTIRAHNVQKDIFVMGDWQDEDYTQAAHNNIHFMIDSLDQLYALNQVGLNTECRIPVHIKIDTGLSRFGIQSHDLQTFLSVIFQLNGIELKGICTHLAEKNNTESDFTQEQIRIFLDTISTNIKPHIYIHATTTTDSLLLQNNYFNLFRIGLGLYGYLPSTAIQTTIKKLYPSFSLRPILTWQAPIIRIKTVAAGKTIGYDRAYTAHQDMKIAFIPVGYSDGFSMALTKQNYLYIDEKKVPIIGTAAMNICIIDITNIDNAQIGTMVTLFDTKIGNELIKEHKPPNGWNIRTLLSMIGRHIPRIIKK